VLWQILVFGAGGGLLNALLVEGNILVWPKRVAIEARPGRFGLDLGFLGNVLMGVGAAALTYFLGDIGKLDAPHQYGLLFGGGLGGSSVLNGFLQGRTTRLNRRKAAALLEVSEKMADQ
jgi:hypothetical protein